jgi:outer membrane protein insertion porin family
MLPGWPFWAGAAERDIRIALFPLEVISTAPDGAADLQAKVQEGITAELRKARQIRLVEHERIAASAGKTLSGDLLIDIGRQAGTDFTVSGSVTEFGDQISVDVRLFDVARGMALPGVFVQGRGRQNLGAILARLRMDIVSSLTPEQRIARVEFRGNRKIEGSAIHQVLKSVAGNPFSEEDLSNDLKAIFKMGYFDDVTVEVTDAQEGKLITFVVAEKPLVTEVRITGNKALKRDDIEGAMSVRSRQTLNPERLKSDMEKIKDLYDSKGYYDAEVDYKIEKDGERDVQVVVTVVENEKLYIRSISFEGNRSFTSKELRNMMATSEKGFFSFFTDSGLLKSEQLRQDVEKIKAFYLNSGFINAQIGEPGITHDRDGIHIRIAVVEGKQFRVGRVAITGDELATPRTALFKALQFTRKDFFDRESIMKDIDFLTQACNDEGYANASVVPRIVPQEETQTVDVSYEIDKAKLVYFNRIQIMGNTKTRDKVIRRELAMVEGDLFSRTKLKNSYMALTRLRYFEEIDFQVAKGTAETLADLNISVKEKATGLFSIGAGYSAVDRAVFTAQVSQQNLFGRAQILSLKASLGSRTTLYDLSFVEPWLFDLPLWSKADLWKMSREYDSYNLDTEGFGATLGYPLFEKVVGYLGYRLSINDVKDILPTAADYIKEQAGETTTSGMSVTLSRDTTTDPIFPTSGSKNSVTLEYTGGPFQGDVSYTRYGASSAWFFPLPLETSIGVRGRIGYVHGNEGKEVPVYERYTLGGINSLRGLREVGPKDPATGDVIGGLKMLNFNVDFLFPLIKNAGMKGVLFFDAGNAWESSYDVGNLRMTAGVGVRWYSPIGPLRLEWGYVLDKKEYESPSRWEFTIGMFM